MANLEMKRHFAAPPERVFKFITQSKHLSQWWGPEGITLGENQLDLSRPGPWSSVMHNSEGGQHKVTGDVIAVEEGKSVVFTWAWHDEEDCRGEESEVRFEVVSDGKGGTEFTMLHSNLPDDDSVHNHQEGWGSSLIKLDRYAQQIAA